MFPVPFHVAISEPDGAWSYIPRSDRGVDVCGGGEGEARAGWHGGGVGRDGRAADIAADDERGHVSNGVVGVVRWILAHLGPCGRHHLVLDERGRRSGRMRSRPRRVLFMVNEGL